MLQLATISNTKLVDQITGKIVDASKSENTLIFFSSTDITSIDHIITECVDFLETHHIYNHLSAEVILRELLMNAMIHGNNNNPVKSVVGKISVFDDSRISISVKDSGKGFDYRALDLTLPINTKNEKNHGLSIVKTMSDRLRFNESGNKVTAILDVFGAEWISAAEEWELAEEDVAFNKSLLLCA